MDMFKTAAGLCLLAALLCTAWPVRAGDGHDHGAEAPPSNAPVMPRFAAVSETFELVGVLDGRTLTLYLDRFADNAPVNGAQIELDLAGGRSKAEALDPEDGQGVYRVMLQADPAPGVLAVTATVNAGGESDLLAGELDVHDLPHAEEAEAGWHGPAAAWWGAGGVAAVLLLGLAFRSRGAARRARAGGVA